MVKTPYVALLGLLTVLSGGACTDSALSPAASGAVPFLHDDRSSPEPAGAPFSIPIPATNGFGIGGNGWVDTHFEIPEGQWAHVQVIGGVSYVANASCYYASGPCDRSLHGLTTGPLFPRGASHVRVGYQVAGQPPPDPYGSMAELGMYPVGGSEETAMESAALLSPYRPFKLWVRRVIVNGGSWDPFAGSTGAQYFLGGSQALHVTFVPTPLKVGGPEVVQPGEAGKFTADIVGPFEFRRQLPWGDSIHWQYYPGDTLPEPNPYLGGIWLYECTNQPTCSYTPQRNGRMGVHAYVQYNHLGVRGAVVRVDSAGADPLLSVACTPASLVRGTAVQCTASVSPPAEMLVTRQSARGAEFSFAEQPNATVPQGSVYVWRGTAVASTTVEMRVRVVQNGKTHQLRDQGSFVVIPRTWTPYQLTTPPPHTVGLRGNMQAYPANGVVGNFGLFGLNPFSTPVDSVSSGPNTGLSYFVTKPPYIGSGADVYTHPVLYPPPPGAAWASSSYAQWYNDQNGVPGGTCTQAHVAQLRSEAERHEGLTQASNSHYGVANDAFLTERPDRTLEALYRFRVTNQRLYVDAYNTYRRFITGPLQAKQAAFDSQDYPIILGNLGCLFDDNPTNP